MAATKTSKATSKPATTADATPTTQSHQRIAVRSKAPHFRRAGYSFTRAETVIELSQLTDEQRHAIESEPRLAVRPITQED